MEQDSNSVNSSNSSSNDFVFIETTKREKGEKNLSLTQNSKKTT